MQAEQFYRSSKKDAIVIEFLKPADWVLVHDRLSELEKNQISWQSFQANPGEMAFLTNNHGELKKVLLGAPEKSYFSALASVALKLPAGIYVVQQILSDYDLMAWGMAQYKFVRYKKIDVFPKVLCLNDAQYDRVVTFVDAVYKVRDLINTPAEDMGPDDLGMILDSLAQGYQGQFSSIVGDALLKENFPAIYTVGRAGAKAPRLLKLTWGNVKHPKLFLVGKGVCFDSGGLNLKLGNAMRTMKKDMGGAAQVIGLAQLIMQFKLPFHLHVLIPAVENSIDGQAYRPGDVIRMRNGLHVEIDNTDAEGRLVLADALCYAVEQKAKWVIDFATLTGAARTAVGTEISALFSSHNDFAQDVVRSGMATNDFVWQLPLYEPYMSMLDSNVADMSNSTSSSYAGAITAALFLKRFVSEEVIWAHFDLMAWNVSSKAGKPEGGEAMAMMAVFEYLMKIVQ